jgi:hypothetical protein
MLHEPGMNNGRDQTDVAETVSSFNGIAELNAALGTRNQSFKPVFVKATACADPPFYRAENLLAHEPVLDRKAGFQVERLSNGYLSIGDAQYFVRAEQAHGNRLHLSHGCLTY